VIGPSFANIPAVVLGTGPSLAGQRDLIIRLRQDNKIRIFGVNHTWKDFPVDVLICCDPQFHNYYGKIEGPFAHWHWSKEICDRHGYLYIEGRWFDGLSLDPSWISLNHCSSAQALNLAVHYGCRPLYLAGHDFRYPEGQPRHYFTNLSDLAGEYPQKLRKFSKFSKPDGNDLMAVYQKIAEQDGLPPIYNATTGSALTCFPQADLEAFCESGRSLRTPEVAD